MTEAPKLHGLTLHKPLSITDKVYEELYHRIMNLTLPPGSKLSEADIAGQLGVSRQPVRDAFYRLSQGKLLMVRPQRATVVMPISEKAVHEAIFIRVALELESIRAAIPNMTKKRIDELKDNLKHQEQMCKTDNIEGFHKFDEEFHYQICKDAGHEHVWTLIQNNKAHMDRVRYLSLETFTNANYAFAEHRKIFNALASHDMERALDAMREHISHIEVIVERAKQEHAEYFDTETA